jgi:aspartyl protease
MPPVRPALARALVVAAMLLVSSAGCGGGSGSGVLPTMGTLGSPSVALVATNLVFVNTSVNGHDLEAGSFGMLVDTGSPVVLLDPTYFGLPAPANSSEVQQTVDLGLLDAAGSPVVVVDDVPVLELSSAMMDALGFPGIIGGTMLRDFSVQLDYSAPMMEGFCLGCGVTARADVGDPVTIPFTLKGGGKGAVDLGGGVSTVVTLPATRIPLTVTVEGVDHPFILDTGASRVSIRTTLFDSLTADGRAQMSGLQVQTVDGSSNAEVTRAKSISLGGATIKDPPIMAILPPVTTPATAPDGLLDDISKELDPSGATKIDGLLGGTFLRDFLVTVAYPSSKLQLQPYTAPPTDDEFRRVGITVGLDSTGHNFDVESVYPNSDAAAKGVMAGDIVTAIGGTDLQSIEYVVEADALLEGTPGTTKLVTFGDATASNVKNQTISLAVEDLLPNP